MKQRTLLVLAAGVGKRIKPIVTSKPLLPFMGRTLLEWVVDSAAGLACANTVIAVNPKDKDAVAKLFPKAKIVVQTEPNGMAGAVLATKTVFAGPAVVVNGDDLIGPEIMADFKKQIESFPEKIILTGIKKDLVGAYFDFQGLSLKVVEKPEGKKPSEWAKIVLDYFPKIEDFAAVLQPIGDDAYEQSLNQLEGAVLTKTEGQFAQLKYPHQVLDIAAQLLARLKGKAQIDPAAKIFPGAQVVNSCIGPNVIIGNNALVRDSIIETGSEIGFGTEVARSYVGPESFCHTNYIGDSVIEGASNFGAGAVLANFRFDHQPIGLTGRQKFGAVVGKGAQIGVNASLMPGALVAAGFLIGPGVVWK